MFDQTQLNGVKDVLSSAKTAIVLLPPEPSSDQVGAALSLFLSLEKSGLTCQIGCSSPITVENADFFGVDRIATTIGNQNLLITFDFSENDLKKVDYDVDENGKFTLLIEPQPGVMPPDTSTIRYAYSGASADLVFIIGTNSLEELGKIYADEKTFLDSAKTISLNLVNRPGSFATFNLNSALSTSVSEMVGNLLRELGVQPTADAATNLLTTILDSTNQFQSPKVTPDTFEIVAFLMRAGGHLGRSNLSTSSRFGAFPPSFPAPLFDAPPMTAPTFEDDFSSPPPAPRSIPNDWKKPKVFRSTNPAPIQ